MRSSILFSVSVYSVVHGLSIQAENQTDISSQWDSRVDYKNDHWHSNAPEWGEHGSCHLLGNKWDCLDYWDEHWEQHPRQAAKQAQKRLQ